MILSILIATLNSRRARFEALYKKLRGQVLSFGLHGRVEIISSRDAGQKSIGQKRNELVAAAKGDYVCHVDDDDDCSMDYVVRLAKSCTEGKDCVGFVGRIMWQGAWTPFVHSIQYASYGRDKGGTFRRPPNHLNPVRRGIAVAHRFPGTNYGEDTDWAMSLQRAGALKTEVFLPAPWVYSYTPAPGPKA